MRHRLLLLLYCLQLRQFLQAHGRDAILAVLVVGMVMVLMSLLIVSARRLLHGGLLLRMPVLLKLVVQSGRMESAKDGFVRDARRAMR